MTTPSWVGAERPAEPAARPPATLVAAVAGMAALAVAEAVHVIGRDDLRPALRGFLVVIIAAQVAIGLLALRRSSTAAMLLLLFAITALVASLATGSLAGVLAAAVVLVLLACSLRWFPTYLP